jgi:L-arabinonolactonase
MTEAIHELTVQDELGEGPLWDPQDQDLYWVDIENGCYHRYHPSTGVHEMVIVGEKIGVLALRQSGGMIMATEKGFAFWDPVAKNLERISHPEGDKPHSRFNDGSVDRKGRFWAGTLGDPYNNSLYRLDADLSVHRLDTGIDISNGIGWSPDNRVMYFTDSTPCKIYAYDFNLETGAIENRRVFVDSSDRPGVPDGLTVDVEGFVWSARWGGWCIDRYDPSGRLERSISVPVEFPTSVMFGGQNLDQLFITSARIEIPAHERSERHLDGDLYRIQPGVKGIPETRFAG